jgi:hypothetical protein
MINGRYDIVEWMGKVFGTSHEDAVKHVDRGVEHLLTRPGPGRTLRTDGLYHLKGHPLPDMKPNQEYTITWIEFEQ